MFLIIDNTKNISKAYMTPRLIKTLEKFHIKYQILFRKTTKCASMWINTGNTYLLIKKLIESLIIRRYVKL